LPRFLRQVLTILRREFVPYDLCGGGVDVI
jgi:hypothetical protein